MGVVVTHRPAATIHLNTQQLVTIANSVILRIWGNTQSKVTRNISAVFSVCIMAGRIVTHFILLVFFDSKSLQGFF